MQDRQQWISIGAVVLVVAGLGYLLMRQTKAPEEKPTIEQGVQATTNPQTNDLLNRMNVNVPSDATKVQLKDTANTGATGLMTKKENGNKVDVSVIAGLPEAKPGYKYQVFMTDGNNKVALGALSEAKGGWILETSVDKAKVLPRLQVVETAGKQEKVILEGE